MLRVLVFCGSALLVSLILLPAVARGDLADEVSQGHQTADAVRSGEQQCSDLAVDDFETVGEYAMDEFIGSFASHESMNAQMSRMMGPQGEVEMHVALGHRYTGCPGGPSGNWAMPMAAMMNGYGQDQSYGPSAGMMGGTPYGPMMGNGYGGPGWSEPHDDDTSAWVIAAVGLGGALIGGLLVLLTVRWRHPATK